MTGLSDVLAYSFSKIVYIDNKKKVITINKNKKIMRLRFGKFKGEYLEDTPTWYQQWLLKQDWFKMPDEEAIGLSSLYKDLISKKKVYSRSNWVYMAEGLYLTPDGDMVELD